MNKVFKITNVIIILAISIILFFITAFQFFSGHQDLTSFLSGKERNIEYVSKSEVVGYIGRYLEGGHFRLLDFTRNTYPDEKAICLIFDRYTCMSMYEKMNMPSFSYWENKFKENNGTESKSVTDILVREISYEDIVDGLDSLKSKGKSKSEIDSVIINLRNDVKMFMVMLPHGEPFYGNKDGGISFREPYEFTIVGSNKNIYAFTNGFAELDLNRFFSK